MSAELIDLPASRFAETQSMEARLYPCCGIVGRDRFAQRNIARRQ